MLPWVIAAGFSTGVFIWQVTHFKVFSELISNTSTDTSYYPSILRYGGIAAAVFALHFAGLAAINKTKEAFRLFGPHFTRLAPFLLLMFIAPLTIRSAWRIDESGSFLYMAIFGAFVFCLAVKADFGPWRVISKSALLGKKTPVLLALLAAAAVYMGYFSYFTILQHYQFGTHAYDLGIYENAFLNAYRPDTHLVSYGYEPFLFLLRSSAIYYLWLPWYVLFPKTETLLIIQSTVVALAAFPLFFLAKRLLHSRLAALCIALLYLLHPGNHGGNFFDVHERATLPLLVFSLFYFLEARKYHWYYLFLVFSIGVKQDVGLALIPVALYILVVKKSPLHGLWTAALCVAGAFLYQYLPSWPHLAYGNLPAAPPGGHQSVFDVMGHLYFGGTYPEANGALDIIASFLIEPLHTIRNALSYPKILYALQMLGPAAFLPLLSGWNILFMSYGFALAFLGTWPPLHYLSAQYVWYVIPFLFFALIRSLRCIKLTQRASRKTGKRDFYGAAMLTLVLCSLTAFWQYGAIPSNSFFKRGAYPADFAFTLEDKSRVDDLKSIISKIPQHATLSASGFICPHLARFRQLQIFPVTTGSAGPVDYLLLFNPNHEHPEELEKLTNSHEYEPVEMNEYFQLFKHK